MRLSLFAFVLLSLAPAVSAQEVNVYSYREPELIKPLTDRFTQETGIDVNVAFLNKGMIERLKAEGRRSPADVILTVDISRLAGVVAADATQPVDSSAITAQIPEAFRDPNGHWFGLTTRARIIYASKDRVGADEITSYEDLADPKWQGRICTRSGIHAYMLALTAAYLYHHGTEDTTAWLQGLKSNLARKPQGNDRAQVKAIWAGECDISLGNTYYMGQMLADPEQTEWANSVRLAFPTLADMGTHMNVSGMAMAKHAPNPEEALAFMQFLASETAQQIYAETNYEYPVDPNTPVSELVKAWGTFTPDPTNLMDIAARRPDALRLTQDVDFDG